MKTILSLTLFAMLATGAMLVTQPSPAVDQSVTGSISKKPGERPTKLVPGEDAVLDRP